MPGNRPLTVLVLARPNDPQLAALDRLPEDTRIVAGDTPEAFEPAAPEADVIFSWWTPRRLLEDVFAMTPRVRWVHVSSAGIDTLLFPALVDSPVPLTNARGAFSASLGEFAVAAMLFFAKDLRRMVRSQAAGKWDPFDVELLAGRTLGIVGYGDIGRAVADRARPFGMKLIAVRRRPELCRDDPRIDRVFPLEEVNRMLPECDYVVLAAPLTPATRGLIGEAELAAMKPTAVLINVGRGAVADERAIVRALEEKRIRGAALDVFECEPLPGGHPFYRLENVLLSPHCADHTAGWLEESMKLFLDNFERFRKGEPLRNIVDKRAGY